MFARLARVVVHHPWRVIGVWLIAAIAVIALAPKLTATTDEASFLPSHYESIQAMNLQEQAFPHAESPAAIVVVERSDGARLTPADTAKVDAIAESLDAAHVPAVTAVQAGPPSPNGLIQTIGIQMVKVDSPTDKSQQDAVKTLRTDLQDQLRGTDLKAGITGSAAQALDQSSSGNKAEAIIAIATIVLILGLLLIIFRSPVIALLPVIVIGAISQIATGLIATVSKLFDLKIDSSVTSMLIVVLFGVGTDYILFLMFRYRERLRDGDDPKTAMIASVTRVGEAITSAAGAVIIAFLALTLSTLGLFRALGPALAIAVAVTLLAGLTLIPAVVSLLGTKVFWPSKSWQREPTGARFAALGSILGKHPGRVAIASGGVMAVLAIAAFGFQPTFDLSAGSTASSAESTVYAKELLKGLPAGATEPTQVFLRSDDGAPLSEGDLVRYHDTLAGVSGVGQVTPPLLSEHRDVAEFRVSLSDSPESNAAIDTVSGPLRTAAHDAAPSGTSALVGGITAVYADIQSAVNHDYTVVFPVAAVLIMIILAVMLRSLVAPWYLMASVGLGFGATLGATVLVFQHIRGEPGLIFMLPVIMYLFVVALGTDYNILMIARLREEAREGRNPRDAAAMAVRHAGPTVAAAGVILAGTFASMMLAGNTTLSQMGFAISIGIVIAAFVMALFFTPAITALIGHAAWWPGHRDRSDPDDAPEQERTAVPTGS
ncbi:MMPL family transporter [Speluncibacter jeojiensis]|uniref:MMPL family transporter n=1 Tax=Speluncibacter jeojiensis TaxID=2710754 RepID=A0A9X4RDL4_9ACTN|nr:MMPL family transporter [Corynebacteriales bacterium D3-21]